MGTFCGLPPPVSSKVTSAFNAPFNCGVNTTLMVQVAFPARVEGQLLVSEKLVTREPVIEILVIATDVVPMLVTVMFCGWLAVPLLKVPKVRLGGEKFITVAVPGRGSGWRIVGCAVGDSQGASQNSRLIRNEHYVNGAASGRGQAGRAIISLRVGSSGRDAGDGYRVSAGVSERRRLRSTARSDQLGQERHGRRRKRNRTGGGDAGESDALRAVHRAVGKAQNCATRAGSGGSHCDAHDARRSKGQRSAAGIGADGVIAGCGSGKRRSACNCKSTWTAVGQGCIQRGGTYSDCLVAEVQR